MLLLIRSHWYVPASEGFYSCVAVERATHSRTLTRKSQMNDASGAFAGVAFHCYQGAVSQQDSFHNAYPNKEIYFTECSGEYGSDWWSDIKVCAAC